MPFPSAIPDRADLLTPVNNYSAQLSAAVSSTDKTLSVTTVRTELGLLIPSKGIVSVGPEIIRYNGIHIANRQLLNCDRGFDGTVAVPHNEGEELEMRWVAAHHNLVADTVYDIAAALGINLTVDHNNAQVVFQSLADRLSHALPYIVPFSAQFTNEVINITHQRRRIVGVQVFVAQNQSNNLVYRQAFPPITQFVSATGSSTVQLVLDGPITGFAVLL